jgi:GNAT superfamily N-acetyltransferase
MLSIRSSSVAEYLMPSQIRLAALADVPQLKRIRSSVRENVLNPMRVSDRDYEWFVQNGLTWVWEEGVEILGFAAGDLRDGSVWALFVHPVWEGRGIGRALLERVCASLCAAGHGTATLDTEPYTRAARFYGHQGWTEEGLDATGQLRFRLALPRREAVEPQPGITASHRSPPAYDDNREGGSWPK